MDMNRNWTAFAVEAEYDAYGASRLCAAHNALRFEVESLRMAMDVMKAAMPEPEVDGDVFVQPVPDHCDRITWRNGYYHLPLKVGDGETAITDSERLEWLMRNVSGKEFRRLGVIYGGNCGRDRIDAAMKTHNAEVTRPGGFSPGPVSEANEG